MPEVNVVAEMPDEKSVIVRFYTCDCEWASKYCDEYHSAVASVPVSVLEQYRR